MRMKRISDFQVHHGPGGEVPPTPRRCNTGGCASFHERGIYHTVHLPTGEVRTLAIGMMGWDVGTPQGDQTVVMGYVAGCWKQFSTWECPWKSQDWGFRYDRLGRFAAWVERAANHHSWVVVQSVYWADSPVGKRELASENVLGGFPTEEEASFAASSAEHCRVVRRDDWYDRD